MPSTAAPDDVVVVIDALSPPADALAASLDRLARWSLERGVRWSANEVEVKTIRLSNHATHRGVFATRAIDGDVQKDLIVIPRSAMIACDGLDVAGDGEERRADEAEARDELALKLLRHRSAGARDAFAPYVESMPKKYNLLQSWSEDEIEELQDARAKALAFRRKAETRRAFERVKDQVRDIIRSGRDDDNVVNDDEIFDAYEWARATVSSRAVSVPFHAAGALCPMGDMFNYAPHDPPILIDVIGAPTFGMREETTSEGDPARRRRRFRVTARTTLSRRRLHLERLCNRVDVAASVRGWRYTFATGNTLISSSSTTTGFVSRRMRTLKTVTSLMCASTPRESPRSKFMSVGSLGMISRTCALRSRRAADRGRMRSI